MRINACVGGGELCKVMGRRCRRVWYVGISSVEVWKRCEKCRVELNEGVFVGLNKREG